MKKSFYYYTVVLVAVLLLISALLLEATLASRITIVITLATAIIGEGALFIQYKGIRMLIKQFYC